MGIFLHEMESGLVQIRTRSSATRYVSIIYVFHLIIYLKNIEIIIYKCRFGCVGPLMDGMVVSVSSLSSLLRLTILNVTRRNIVEVDK